MKYYLLIPDEWVENSVDLFANQYVLVDESFGVLYADHGFHILHRILHKLPGDISELQIKTDDGGDVTISEFMELLETHEIRLN